MRLRTPQSRGQACLPCHGWKARRCGSRREPVLPVRPRQQGRAQLDVLDHGCEQVAVAAQQRRGTAGRIIDLDLVEESSRVLHRRLELREVVRAVGILLDDEAALLVQAALLAVLLGDLVGLNGHGCGRRGPS